MMNDAHQCPLLCRFCFYYQFEGRRGGFYQLFNMSLCGQWEACCYAVPTFPEPSEKTEFNSQHTSEMGGSTTTVM
jgi:hypothetical protein